VKNFRKHHLHTILEEGAASTLPLDAFLSDYFRGHRAIGSKDRREICEAVYAIIRNRSLIDYHLQKPITWADRAEALPKLAEFSADKSIPPHIRVSFPKGLFDLIIGALGEEKGMEFCRISNGTAPVTLRANLLKTTREALLAHFAAEHSVKETPHSKAGLQFPRKHNFFSMDIFKEGHFEIQDEGSQLVADLVEAKPGDEVLDYCAGAGGKTLAIAPKLEGTGQIYLYDIRPLALAQAKKRLKRAGIQNAQILETEDLKRKGMQKRFDWVLVDAPCSGLGTLRRNPDMKWKINKEMIDRLVVQQREIVAAALPLLAPGGTLVYATCSIFPEENEKQLDYFLQHLNLTLVDEPLSLFPVEGGMDGFFGARLKLLTPT